MSAEQFEPGLKFVLRWEGTKFTNHPDDRGGPTRYGVTQRVYDDYRKGQGRPTRSVEQISDDEVRAIYRTGYWARVKGEQLPSPVDLVLFDTGVLMGVGRAARFLQQALGVAVDGAIGPDTLGALEAAPPLEVARRILDLREARLRGIVAADASQRKFLKGWLNRLNDLRRLVGVPVGPAEAVAVGADLDASVESEDEPTVDAVGRVVEGPPDEEPGPVGEDVAAGPSAGPPLRLLVPASPGAVLDGARRLHEEGAAGLVCVLDVVGSSSRTLRVHLPGAAAGAEAIDVPAAAVDAVTPLGIDGADPGRILVSLAFRPGFESLPGLLRRAAGGARPSDAGLPGAEEALGREPEPGPSDDDPAAPGPAEVSEVADLTTARTLANLGTGAGTEEAFQAIGPTAETAALPVLAVDVAGLRAFLHACTTSAPRVTYGLGKKVPFFGAVPGKDFTRVDCSGFVREAIRRPTEPRVPFPDGSVVQHEWVRAKGFRKSTVEAAFKRDGALRIAFFRPQDSPSKVGHVVLVHDGTTLESHSGVGPNSRPWTGAGWQRKAYVYRLTDPVS